MHSPSATARLAGLSYLGLIAAGITAEFFLRAPLVSSDSAGTAAALAGNETLWRLSLVADLVMATLDVALALLLFLLFRPVDEPLALAAMILRLLQMAVIVAQLPLLLAALSTTDPLPLIARHAAGYDLGLWFFGLNGLVMAVLLRRAGAPRGMPVMIGAGGLVYLLGTAALVLAPSVNSALEAVYLLPFAAELWFAVWLLRGARAKVRG